MFTDIEIDRHREFIDTKIYMKNRDRYNDDIKLKSLKSVDLKYLNNFEKQKQNYKQLITAIKS